MNELALKEKPTLSVQEHLMRGNMVQAGRSLRLVHHHCLRLLFVQTVRLILQTRKISVYMDPEFRCLCPELLSWECAGSLRQLLLLYRPKSLDRFRKVSDLRK